MRRAAGGRVVALAAALTLAASSALACSPEANRQRNGGPGADIGNRSPNSPEPSQAPIASYRAKGEPSGPGQKP